MHDARPTEEELRYLGLTDLQIILLSDFPDDLVAEVYQDQLVLLMGDGDDTLDF
jgi:hypothetical protein